jgi:hypothetical protein
MQVWKYPLWVKKDICDNTAHWPTEGEHNLTTLSELR